MKALISNAQDPPKFANLFEMARLLYVRGLLKLAPPSQFVGTGISIQMTKNATMETDWTI